MKTKYFIIALFTVTLTMVSCSESFLDQPPYGSVITQEQYEKLDGALEGSMRGIYSMMYAVSDHDLFGKRSLDLSTDMLSGDIALTAYSYGWYHTDESGQTAIGRTGYVWSYYYGILRNINKVLNMVSAQSDITKRVAEFGLPNTYNEKSEKYYNIVDGDTLATFTLLEAELASYYAQALAMRGYCYSNLINLYAPTNIQLGGAWESEVVCPIYNENNLEEAQPVAVLKDVYQQVENDLTLAISYFDAFAETNTRTTKLSVDGNVARAILAYSYLNKAVPTLPSGPLNFEKALKYAKEVIDSQEYKIISNANVLTTGFNDVSENSWMWGQDVTTETAGGLASFFGQVDIHSYSYAWAGDTKVIDQILYDSIPAFDIRKKWFNDGKKNPTFKLCPDGKFFSAKNPTSTADEDIDREWLSDNVFMRIESMYLIAAEASYRLQDYTGAIDYLRAITDQRVDTAATAATAYAEYIAKLDASNLLAQIEYNWRVEMWGEGYALQTFRRLSPETEKGVDGRKRGGNHSVNAGTAMKATADQFTFPIPSSETSYNPHYGTKLP
jgi:tetratricopeptide (TPR) repeat protein